MHIEDPTAPSTYTNMTYRVETPEGTMFVAIMEAEDGRPAAVQINIGKAGILLSAWANALSRIITIALEHGATINDLIAELSSQTTDKVRRANNGVKIRSGPEGVCYALMQHHSDAYSQWCKRNNVDPNEPDLPRLDP